MKKFLQEEYPKHQAIKQIYQYIHQHGPITKSELVELTRIKQTTMVRHLEELMDSQYIQIRRYEKSSGGRPPALYEINSISSYLIGIDLSRTYTEIILLDLHFKLVDRASFTMTSHHTPAVTINLIKQKITKLLARYDIDQDCLLGIGIGTVGPLDRKSGFILDPALFPSSGWQQVAIVNELEKAFNQKVIIENGANTAVLGEYIHIEDSADNLLYCISGRGLRCGFLANGQFVQNQTGDASGFGEMVLYVNPEDNEKNKTLSNYVSLEAILKETIKRNQDDESLPIQDSNNKKIDIHNMQDLLDAIEKGDSVVQNAVLTSAYYYGVGLANMINITHPDKVILKSKLIDHYPAYYHEIINTAKQHIYRYDQRTISFETGKVKSAVSIGAAVLIFNSYFNN